MNFSDEDIKQSAAVIRGDYSSVSSTVKDVVGELVASFTPDAFDVVLSQIEQSTDFTASDVIYLMHRLAINNIHITFQQNPSLRDIVDNYRSLIRSAR